MYYDFLYIFLLSLTLYIFIVFRIASYHIDEVAQTGTQSLLDYAIVLPKHVGDIVKNKEVYNSVHLLVNLYILRVLFIWTPITWRRIYCEWGNEFKVEESGLGVIWYTNEGRAQISKCNCRGI
jgi:hypothetical protein